MTAAAASRVPQPALVRGLLVAVTSIVAVILGHALSTGWIDMVTDIYAGVSPLIAGALIHPAVVPKSMVSGGHTESAVNDPGLSS